VSAVGSVGKMRSVPTESEFPAQAVGGVQGSDVHLDGALDVQTEPADRLGLFVDHGHEEPRPARTRATGADKGPN
jgi:hypothetical protein